MPYFAKRPFSFATNRGDASVSAMKPSFAAVTSGPAVCANAPPGKLMRAAASSAAVPAPAFKRLRRSILRLVKFSLVVLVIVCVVLSSVIPFDCPASPRSFPRSPKAKAAPVPRADACSPGQRLCCLVRRGTEAYVSACNQLFKDRASLLRCKIWLIYSLLDIYAHAVGPRRKPHQTAKARQIGGG